MKSLILHGNEDGHTVEINVTNSDITFYAHYGSGSPYIAHVTRDQARELYEYLDMENVPAQAFVGTNGMILRVYQEADGRTWVRVYRDDTGGRLVFLPDGETERLYDWLGDLLG